jgi:hypothetical protein
MDSNTSMSVDLRWAPVELSWSSDMVRFHDAAAGVEYLRGFKADLYMMALLRRRLAESGLAGDVSRLSDEQVIGAMAAHMASGRLWLWRQRPKFVYPGGSQEAPPPSTATAPPPRETGSGSPPPPEPEEPTLGNVDPAAQAATLRNAALLGAPFCEECARRAGGGA